MKLLNLGRDHVYVFSSNKPYSKIYFLGNDFWSFFKINARFIASVVLVSLLFILALATCLKYVPNQ
jgi:hypothetical protein